MIITWGKGRATKIPNKAIQERKTEERVGGEKGAQPVIGVSTTRVHRAHPWWRGANCSQTTRVILICLTLPPTGLRMLAGKNRIDVP